MRARCRRCPTTRDATACTHCGVMLCEDCASVHRKGAACTSAAGSMRPAEIENCGACRFFRLEDPNGEAGLCVRFPRHSNTVAQPIVEARDYCGEFQKRGIRFTVHAGEPVTINDRRHRARRAIANDPRCLPEQVERRRRDRRARWLDDPGYRYHRGGIPVHGRPLTVARPTTKTLVGNYRIELTPLEAAVVEQALRIGVHDLQLSERPPRDGVIGRTSKISILNGVIDRFPAEVDE